MEVTGYYNERFETWIPNNHLNLYNYFILYLSTVVHKNAYLSTCLSKAEKDFQIIMDNKFIQGIKLEDIKNYEESLKSNSNNQSLKKPSRNISRGISRGISYDTDEESRFDETIKKDFINGIVNASEDSTTSYKRFLDFIYFKTSKRNFLRLNQSTKSILDVERYFAACLFKQLGLISTCLDLFSIVTVTPSQEYKKIEVPNVLIDLWKKNIYPLRNKLLFAYQKSISNSNPDQDSIIYNFKEYSEEIKQKCILLLYSDPILKFQVENKELTNETFELAMKNIFTFVTSKLPLSDINTIIDTQRERLSISTQSLTSILSFVNQNSLFNSSKSVFALSYDLISKRYSCQCLKQHELDDFDKLFGTFSISFIQNVFDHPSLSMLLNMKCLFSLTVSHEDNESRLKCSKLIIDLLKSNSNNNKSIYRDRTNFNLVLVLLAIVIKSENEELIEYMVSLLSQENIDFCSKKLILIIIPFMIKIFNNKAKLLNESIIFSLLDNNYKNPFIIKNLFYWISSIFSEMKSSNNQDFILKVLKGIGQSFIGKSCLFIDDSFKPFTHRQVSESMISFIRILFNTQNESLFIVIHDILTKSIKEVKFGEYNDEMMILIGLCASLGSSLSALEPGRYITNGADYNDANLIVSYNELENKIRVLTNSKRKTYELVNTNIVFLKFIDFDLNDQEIENILQLHKNILNSKYFTEKEFVINNTEISDKEIAENVLISTFYSFLAIIMQNVNNMELLLNEKNIKNTLSVFDISNQAIPSNSNSIYLLSHHLEQSITNSLYNETINDIDINNKIRFMKMNFGEVIYGKENDIIKTNKNHVSVFACNRLFDFETETYFNLKIDNIDKHNIFIGFINSEEDKYQKAFGFHKLINNKIYRRSLYIPSVSFSINDIKSIGCYYTPKFVYLIINERLTPYRISHPKLKSYIPIIYVINDELEINVLQNVTIVDRSSEKFDFLNINNISENSYKEKDTKENFDQKIFMNNYIFNKYEEYKSDNLLIGQMIEVSKIALYPYLLEMNEMIPPILLDYEDNAGIVKDINLIDGNKYLFDVEVESYNNKKLSKETIKLKSRYIQNEQTSFFKIIENRTNTKFGLNSSFSLKHLIDKPNNDLNSIKKFVKIKTIFDNSKSLAILMSRFLVFILLDYLRFSKSNLLQEEGINSNEMKLIINSLVHSLRTIALFSPDFKLDANKIANDDYLIFQNEQDENEIKNNSLTEYYKMTGNYYFFNISFIMFLKKSESFISPHFLSNLISKSYEISIQGNSIKITDLYNLIQSKYKLESSFPLSNEFSINKFDNTKFNSSDHKITEFDIDNISGFVPILISSIPDQLPSVIFNDRRFRLSSDQVTYIQLADRRYHSIQFNWVYNIDSLKNKYKEYSYDDDNINNYELEFGLFTLFEQLPEFIVESSFGFINILFSVIRALNFTELFLDQKNNEMLIFEILEKVFSLTLNKNPLVYPFIKPIISTLSSLIKFSDLLLSKEASESFEYLSLNSNVLYPIENFPTLSSEAPVIFSIYSSLINAFSKEKVIIDLTKSNNSFVVNNISDLFDCFCNVNDELFSINDIHQFNKLNFTEGTFVKDNHNRTSIQTLEKKKNYRLFYQLYYYSILLSNENNLPYPKFLFFHDWIRQHFGSLRMAVTNGDINKYEKSNAKEDKKLLYKSDVINNDFDLECSYDLISIFNVQNGKKEEGEEEEVEQEQLTSKSFKVIVHQLKDDKQIELNQQGEKVLVSFPLEFQIFNLDENDKKQLKKGDSFIIEFTPSIEQEKKYFIEHYNQFQIEFNQFISLGKYDTKLSEFAIISKKKNEKESEEDSSSASNNYDDMGVVIATLIQGDPLAEHFIHDSYMLSFYLQHSFNVSSLEEFVKKLKSETSRDDYKFYELERIPTKIEFNFNPTSSEFNESIISLRYWILSYYNSLIEEILINYTEKVESKFNDDNESIWGINISLSGKEESLYSKQIIRPAMSMNTESKFRFINQILMNDKKEESNLHLDFNRFESRKFFDNFTKKPENENENKDDKQQRPLFVQLIEQIGDDGIKELKVPRGNPFHAELVDEQAIDAGGPAREVFSSLIIEIMNNNVGIFTFNPNHNHKTEDTNKEDLIPNTQFYGQIYDMIDSSCRFLYAGALIAVCIVSDLPQQMKLASFVWEFLSKNKIENIESIYEVDEEFKKIIEEAEDCKKKLENLQMTEDEFNKVFMQSFTIKDSFDNQVDLIFGGSKKKVTKDNLSQFIELAKNFRIHEFDHELNELKRGFDIIMTKKEITSILRPNELKLLVCGEPNCPVEQMKNLVVILVDNSESHQNDFGEYCAKMKKMFWNVMESLTVDERVGFIRFSSGTNGLPAVGLKWENDLKVTIFSKEKRMKDGKVLPEAHTCFSSVDIPYFESEEELARSIRTAIENGGLITDSNEIPNGIEQYLT